MASVEHGGAKGAVSACVSSAISDGSHQRLGHRSAAVGRVHLLLPRAWIARAQEAGRPHDPTPDRDDPGLGGPEPDMVLPQSPMTRETENGALRLPTAGWLALGPRSAARWWCGRSYLPQRRDRPPDQGVEPRCPPRDHAPLGVAISLTSPISGEFLTDYLPGAIVISLGSWYTRGLSRGVEM